ncbi:hypothetical protein CEY15_07190 [Dietzia natronolimnaea]|uniref:Uncharacterized protein n=1 Tax=Dietzia natronolimnaea TaxID=161920 RepID=A0A2A2WR47_9ACTN|nr:hypothetical protein CEY15_07190 [Dietzia natronolimnaea]
MEAGAEIVQDHDPNLRRTLAGAHVYGRGPRRSALPRNITATRTAAAPTTGAVRDTPSNTARVVSPWRSYSSRTRDYHPPSRRDTADRLVQWARGEDFRYV